MLQSEIVVEVQAYASYGFIYVVHGDRLFQVDHNYFLELMPGNEVYGNIMRTLRKQTPIAHRELVTILSKLIENIKELI